MKAVISDATTLELSPDGGDGSVYSDFYTVSFSKDTSATGIYLESFNLEGDFKASDINVLATDSAIQAQLETPNTTTWIIRLPRPMAISRVNIQSITFAKVHEAEAFIEAGFFDHVLPNGLLSLSAAAVIENKNHRVRDRARKDFAEGKVWEVASRTLDIFPVVGDKIMEQSIATVSNNGNIDGLILDAFAVRSTDKFRNQLESAKHNISVYVHSQPQGLKVMLAPLNDGVPDVANGEALPGVGLDSNLDTVVLADKHELWQSSVQKFLDTYFASAAGAERLQVGIVMQSEEPCQFLRKQFSNNYKLSLVDRGFLPVPEGAEAKSDERKLVLHGKHWQSHSLPLSLPDNSHLHFALMKFKYTLNKEPFVFTHETPDDKWLTTATGVELNSSHWAGGTFQLDAAQSVRHMLLPVMASQENTTCVLEIREDVSGSPSGTIVTQQTLNLTNAGKRLWAVLTLDDPLALYSKKLWWLLKTTQGSAVQFVHTDEQASGVTYFNLSSSGGPGSVFRFTKSVRVKPLFAKDASSAEKLHFFVQSGNKLQRVGSSSKSSANTYQQNLLSVLPDTMADNGSSFSLHVASLLKGRAELFPPEYLYEPVTE